MAQNSTSDNRPSSFTHVQYLAGAIGPRGSCTPDEALAAKYVLGQLQSYGVKNAHLESFGGAHSAYARYAVIFLLAALSSPLALVTSGWIGGVVFSLGAIAMFLESDFRPNWSRWIIRDQPSQNVVGSVPAKENAIRRIVLTSHLDSHRTPIFNSNRSWQKVYQYGFRLLFLSLILGALAHLSSLLPGWDAIRWLSVLPALLLVIGGIFFVGADRSPISPGAYDNASGAATLLTLAETVAKQPLSNSEVWFAFTGCEETGSQGAAALLDTHLDDWGNLVYINLDQMGIGELYIRLSEGMLRRYHVRPQLLALARQAAQETGVILIERASSAFSDASPAHQRKLAVLSFGTQPTDPDQVIPRHTMGDLPDVIEPEALARSHQFICQLLENIDKASLGSVYE